MTNGCGISNKIPNKQARKIQVL